MRQFQIRKIAENKGVPVYGLTIPNYIAEQYLGIYFYIEKDSVGLKLTSGASLVETRKNTPRIMW